MMNIKKNFILSLLVLPNYTVKYTEEESKEILGKYIYQFLNESQSKIPKNEDIQRMADFFVRRKLVDARKLLDKESDNYLFISINSKINYSQYSLNNYKTRSF